MNTARAAELICAVALRCACRTESLEDSVAGALAGRRVAVVKELFTALKLHKATASRVMGGLEDSGRITRVRNRGDRRSVDVAVTGDGTESYHAAVREAGARSARWMDAMTPEELDAVRLLLLEAAHLLDPSAES